MQCPHCLSNILARFSTQSINYELERNETVEGAILFQPCPVCKKHIIYLVLPNMKEYAYCHTSTFSKSDLSQTSAILLNPKNKTGRKLPAEVPQSYVKEFDESQNVLPLSPNASAAISRRCLQRLLREKAGVKLGDLHDEIQQVLDSNKLPASLADAIDAIRNIGNFGAHAIKSKQSGSIVDVEIGEADWNLDVLEQLFDFYFVQPAILVKRKDALNQKLKDAGKPPMK